MCHKSTCTDNLVTVTVEDTDFPCINNGTVLTVDTLNFNGTINCPANMNAFCNHNLWARVCKDNCHYGGYCIGFDNCACGVNTTATNECIRPNIINSGYIFTAITGIFLLFFFILA